MSAPPMPAAWLAALPEPVKNRFFYGMLLNEHVLTRDQDYFEAKRWLVNRLTLGTGVLAGLTYRVASTADDLPKDCHPRPPGPGPWVVLDAGVAVDDYGREIVVPSCRTGGHVWAVGLEAGGHFVPASDPAAFLDAAKAALGVPDAPKAVYLVVEVGYDPVPADHEPVRAGTCPSRCEAGAIREGFRVRFRPVGEKDGRPGLQGLPAPPPGGDPVWTPPAPDPTDPAPRPQPVLGAPGEELPRADPNWNTGALPDVFPPEPPEAVRHRQAAQGHADLAAAAVPAVPGDDPCHPAASWVPVGVVRCGPADDKTGRLVLSDAGRYFRQLFGNDALSRLMFGLAERADEAARVRVLTHAGTSGDSGDGQAADVYHPLPKALKVRVTDGRYDPATNTPVPNNLESVKVRFEVLSPAGGQLARTPLDPTKPPAQDPPGTGPAVEVDVDATTGLAADVYWRLGQASGPHTVAARVIAANRNTPPFHPGLQVVFTATARPTAPTVVGVEFANLWCHNDCGKYEWSERGDETVRLTFSRKLDGTDWLPDAFRVWAVYRVGDRGPVLGPRPFRPEVVPGSYRPVGFAGPDGPAEIPWQVDCWVPGLVAPLCTPDRLRVVVLGRHDPATGPRSVPGPAFPVAQVLDPTFAASFLTPRYRQLLWDWTVDADPRYLTDPVDAAVRDHQPPDPPHRRPHGGVPHLRDEVIHLHDWFWDRFRPRARSLPSGDGAEGGTVPTDTDFHLALNTGSPATDPSPARTAMPQTRPQPSDDGLARARYFDRQVVRPADLTQDQTYLLDRLRRHNRLLHGWGEVSGLGVGSVVPPPDPKTKASDPAKYAADQKAYDDFVSRAGVAPPDVNPDPTQWVVIHPGYALSPSGEEIAILRPVFVNLIRERPDGTLTTAPAGCRPAAGERAVPRTPDGAWSLVAEPAEEPAGAVRAAAGRCGDNPEHFEYSRTRDTVVFRLVAPGPLPEPYPAASPPPTPAQPTGQPYDPTRVLIGNPRRSYVRLATVPFAGNVINGVPDVSTAENLAALVNPGQARAGGRS